MSERLYYEIICGEHVIGCCAVESATDPDLIHYTREDDVDAFGLITKAQFHTFGDNPWETPISLHRFKPVIKQVIRLEPIHLTQTEKLQVDVTWNGFSVEAAEWGRKLGEWFRQLPSPATFPLGHVIEKDGQRYKTRRWRDGIDHVWMLHWELIDKAGESLSICGGSVKDPDQTGEYP